MSMFFFSVMSQRDVNNLNSLCFLCKIYSANEQIVDFSGDMYMNQSHSRSPMTSQKNDAFPWKDQNILRGEKSKHFFHLGVGVWGI